MGQEIESDARIPTIVFAQAYRAIAQFRSARSAALRRGLEDESPAARFCAHRARGDVASIR
jgi:hypothetical protein